MARSIVSSPVDPIKDYGETIVACNARTAPSSPVPPYPPPLPAPGVYRCPPAYGMAFTLTAKLSFRRASRLTTECDTLRSVQLSSLFFTGILNVVCAADCLSGDHRIDRKFAKPTSIVIFGIIFEEEQTDIIILRCK